MCGGHVAIGILQSGGGDVSVSKPFVGWAKHRNHTPQVIGQLLSSIMHRDFHPSVQPVGGDVSGSRRFVLSWVKTLLTTNNGWSTSEFDDIS